MAKYRLVKDHGYDGKNQEWEWSVEKYHPEKDRWVTMRDTWDGKEETARRVFNRLVGTPDFTKVVVDERYELV